MWFFSLRRRGPDDSGVLDVGWIVNQIAPRMSVFDNDRRLCAISKIDLVAPDFGLGFRSPDDR